MRRKISDVSLLLSGILLAMCMEYLSPSIRFVFNHIWFGNSKLCQRIQYILTEFNDSLNRTAIIVVIAVAVVMVIYIALLIFRRHDKDDEIIDILKQIRDKDKITSLVGGASHAEAKTTKAKTTKNKPREKGKKSG